jgi:hypothetical protein
MFPAKARMPAGGNCVLRGNLVRDWAAPYWKQPKWQKCIEANHFPQGVKTLYGRPQLTFLIPQTGKARVFRFSHTKDALSSLKMILLLLLICGPRGREAGAFLKRKIKSVRGIQSRPLIDDAADGLRQASPLLDSISN